MPNKIIPYKPHLREYARTLRKNSTLYEIILWKHIKNKGIGVQFHRQVPMLDYIVDFYCHEIGLAIEVDGKIHDYTYLSDAKRQGRLEEHGVQFIRFSNDEIKHHLFHVLQAIQTKVEEFLLEQNGA